MVRPTINSTKHLFQHSISTILAGQVENITILEATDVGAVNQVGEVRTGAIVKAIWVELWVRTGDTAHGSFVGILEKLPGAASFSPTAANMASLHTYQNKKNIFYTTQGLSNDQDADAVPLYKGWIKIPKSKQRMGLGDKLIFTVFAQALDQIICGVFIYKEYF